MRFIPSNPSGKPKNKPQDIQDLAPIFLTDLYTTIGCMILRRQESRGESPRPLSSLAGARASLMHRRRH